MSWRSRNKPDTHEKYFQVPNAVYDLGLTAGEIAVYGYLLRCENRRTYQCWPSYQNIGKAVHMSKNTVKKYVASLEEKRFIATEPTMIKTRDGRKRNGNLRYTIRPIQEAVDYFYERQMVRLEADAERQRIAKAMKETTPSVV